MSTNDTEFFRAFAGRVRNTVATNPEGSPTMSDTTTVETVEVPATFKAHPDAPCSRAWCTETGTHVEHVGRAVTLPEVSAQIWQDTDDAQPTIVVGNPQDDYRALTSGDQLRGRAAQLRTITARLDALADQYDAIREAADAATPRADLAAQWTISTTNGISISGYRPGWDQSLDPSEQNVDPSNLTGRVEDVCHRQWFPGQIAEANLASGTGRSTGQHAILCPQIGVDPFHDDPAKREPTASVELAEGYDDWIEGLAPDGVAALAAKFHAAGDQLLNEVLPALVAAREDWAKNGGTR